MHCVWKIIRIEIVSVLHLNNQWHSPYTIKYKAEQKKKFSKKQNKEKKTQRLKAKSTEQ